MAPMPQQPNVSDPQANHFQETLDQSPLPGTPLPLLAPAPSDDLQRDPTRGIAHLVELQARQKPDADALVIGDQHWTYAEVNQSANRLARHLREQGIDQNHRVGICVDRHSPHWGVAVLAVLKAGGGYVPLDPKGPLARQTKILLDSQPTLVMTSAQHKDTLASLGGVSNLLCLDSVEPALSGIADTNLSVVHHPDQLAYVIYTSGSTGSPKGVAMPQGPLMNLLDWQLASWGSHQAARTLQFAATTFDVAFQELLSIWAAGGTLFPVSDSVRTDPIALLHQLCEFSIQRAFLPVAALHYLAEAVQRTGLVPSALREIITAGEQLEVTPAVQHLAKRLPELSLRNQYGPTETHVVTEHVLSPGIEWERFPPIGRPISQVRVHLLDEAGKRVPAGERGELYLAGAALAHGYWNCERLTSERFVQLPDVDQQRLYRTGDMVSADRDGVLTFLGRADHQVQIRGHRVEPAEVSAAIQSHGGVAQVLVVAELDRDQHPELVAYVQAAPEYAGRHGELPAEIRHSLRHELPKFMWPAEICLIQDFPLTPHGKVDRRALAKQRAAHRQDEQQCNHAAEPIARDSLEWRLLGLWEEVLERPVRLEEDFFDLGGNSLSAMALVTRVEQELGRHAPLAQLLESATVASMAAALRDCIDPERRLVAAGAAPYRRQPAASLLRASRRRQCAVLCGTHTAPARRTTGLRVAGTRCGWRSGSRSQRRASGRNVHRRHDGGSIGGTVRTGRLVVRRFSGF